MNQDIVCFSHLRWNFVHQRPQHLMSRAARERRVLVIEEPVYGGVLRGSLYLRSAPCGVIVAVPMLPDGLSPAESEALQVSLVGQVVKGLDFTSYLAWFYTPMALPLMQTLSPQAIVYDCMDELSAFKAAPADMAVRETELLRVADVVFTGGQSLYRAKRHLHHNVHCFPSAVDFDHFAQARKPMAAPPDQAAIPGPRAGYFGVIDERMDLELVRQLADLLPELQIVMVGPTAKISPGDLPRRPNIHWLGIKRYNELPAYISGWDVALLPFAHNDATRFISPTKVPEYLAAGKPVVSTAIRDVVHPWGVQGLVRIAGRAEGFVLAVKDALSEGLGSRLATVDRALRHISWDHTWHAMDRLCASAVERHASRALVSLPSRLRATPALRSASLL
ncbi:MAG TPA: glycosyltransferase [Gemmatimonadales bacterium]|nr:glycosyltransferase [Gemmatimonadales bacterium]